MLFDLPPLLSHEVCMEWIETADLVRLDSAMSNKLNRVEFLLMLRCKYFSTEGNLKNVPIHQVFQWVMARKTKFNAFAVVDGGVEALPWLQMGFFFRNLRSFKVNLAACAVADRRMMAALRRILLNSSRTLEEFDGTGCLVLDDLFVGMKWPKNSALSTLTTLKLSGGHISLPNIIKLLQHCPNVQHIDFSNTSLVNDAYLKALQSHCPLLKSLDLSHSLNYTEDGLVNLLVGCASLGKVVVRSCSQVSEAAVDALCKLPREIVCVQE